MITITLNEKDALMLMGVLYTLQNSRTYQSPCSTLLTAKVCNMTSKEMDDIANIAKAINRKLDNLEKQKGEGTMHQRAARAVAHCYARYLEDELSRDRLPLSFTAWCMDGKIFSAESQDERFQKECTKIMKAASKICDNLTYNHFFGK